VKREEDEFARRRGEKKKKRNWRDGEGKVLRAQKKSRIHESQRREEKGGGTRKSRLGASKGEKKGRGLGASGKASASKSAEKRTSFVRSASRGREKKKVTLEPRRGREKGRKHATNLRKKKNRQEKERGKNFGVLLAKGKKERKKRKGEGGG